MQTWDARIKDAPANETSQNNSSNSSTTKTKKWQDQEQDQEREHRLRQQQQQQWKLYWISILKTPYFIEMHPWGTFKGEVVNLYSLKI